MKIFLFLYPISIYIDDLVYNWLTQKGIPANLGRLNQIINIRYRQQGYQVYWVVPGLDDILLEPNKTLISDLIEIGAHDHVISNGLTVYDLTACKDYFRDPNSYIFNQLPDPEDILDLKIGGYHQWDCVDKMAHYAYDQVVPTLVDEDTTERYFLQIGCGLKIPDYRIFTPEGMKLTDNQFGSHNRYYQFLGQRQRKPWFVWIDS